MNNAKVCVCIVCDHVHVLVVCSCVYSCLCVCTVPLKGNITLAHKISLSKKITRSIFEYRCTCKALDSSEQLEDVNLSAYFSIPVPQ